MLRPKNQQDHHQRDETGGGSISSKDSGNDTGSSTVCAMSSFNVTVSLQPKSPPQPVPQKASAGYPGAVLSHGSASIGSPSFGSISTTASQSQSLAESIGSFDVDKVEIEAKKALVRPTAPTC